MTEAPLEEALPQDATETHEGVPFDLSKAAPMELLAEVESDTQMVQFLAVNQPNSPEQAPQIGMMIQTREGASDLVSAVREDGATPLEVFLLLAGEGATPPEALARHHAAAVALEEREPEVRQYSEWRLKNMSWRSRQEEICASFDAFRDHVRINTTARSFHNLDTDHALSRTAQDSSSRGVLLFMCNKSSTSSCNRDRKRVTVLLTTGGGTGVVYQNTMFDCYHLRFEFDQRVQGYTYQIASTEGCVYDSSRNCNPSDHVQSYLGLAYQL